MTAGASRIFLPGEAGPASRFAADELRRYLARILAVDLPIHHSGTLPSRSLVLGSSLSGEVMSLRGDGDAFQIEPFSNGACVTGDSERAVLHGVYALLESLGCIWSINGIENEHVPVLQELPPIHRLHRQPRFKVRGYATDVWTWHYLDSEHLASRIAEDRVLVDWMGKTGANTFFFIRHPFDSQLGIPEMLPEYVRRGIQVEYGGHVVPLLLPRELFRENPAFFPMCRGRRSDRGNLCVSSPEALAVVASSATRYASLHPEVSALHVWGADLWGGGWCQCAACESLSPQDQSLLLCNTVARALSETDSRIPVHYLAYHDTLEPHLTVKPDARVWVEFAPRERCYGHTLNDPECRTNRRYCAALERYFDLFRGRVRVFEYYGDSILFCGCAVALTHIIEADLAYFARIGIREITMLQFGAHGRWAYPLNFVGFANFTRAVQHAESPIRTYCREFGEGAPEIERALSALERIMRSIVIYGDIRNPPRDEPRRGLLAERLAQATRDLDGVIEQLGDTAPAQHALLRYTRAVLVGVLSELSSEQGSGAARALYDEALQVIGEVDPREKGLWAKLDLPVLHEIHSSGRFRSLIGDG